MSKIFRLYNSWDQYSCGDHETRDDEMKVTLSQIRRSSSSSQHLSKLSSKSSSSDSFYANSEIQYAVEFNDVKLSVGPRKKPINILRGVNMKHPEGSIYALLGPSGCGKTTLCNCITGRNIPSSGSVRVFDHKPGTKGSNIPGPIIGYMPQEISLFPDFTIEETLLFYSKLYRLERGRARDRVSFLVDFLELPDKTRMVGNLSGGQQRRVSLAAALIHSPPLLILDEPTVGVDPVLRQVIWEYLVLLSTKENLSIIITTHYIEEARAANVCGLMRQGRLLIEESPDYLMEKFNCPTLESVFLQLSKASDEEKFLSKQPSRIIVSQSNRYIDDNSSAKSAKLSHQPVSKANSLSTVQEVSESNADHHHPNQNGKQAQSDEGDKDMGEKDGNQDTIVARHAPSIKQIALDKKVQQELKKQNGKDNGFGTTKMPNGDSIQGVVNGRLVPKFDKFQIEEKPPGKFASFRQEAKRSIDRVSALTAKNFARLLRNLPMLLFQFLLPSVEVILFCICIGQEPFNLPIAVYNQEGYNDTSNLSVKFLDSISNRSVIQVPYEDRDEAFRAVKNGRSWGAVVISESFSQNLRLRMTYPDNMTAEDIEDGSVHLHLDMSNYLVGLQLQRIFFQGFQNFAIKELNSLNMSTAAAKLPVKIEEPIYGIRDPTFTEFMAPGVLLSIAFLAAVALTAIALVQERKEGSLERCLVSGVSSTEFILSHVGTQLLVLHVQVVLLLIFTFLVFEVPSRGPFFWVVLLTLMQSSCGMAYGLMISALVKEETSATMLALGSFYPNLLLSGTVWPTQAMPDFMRYFSYVLPQTIPIESMRYLLSRGWDITYPEVATGFGITGAWTAFFLIVAIVVFKSNV